MGAEFQLLDLRVQESDVLHGLGELRPTFGVHFQRFTVFRVREKKNEDVQGEKKVQQQKLTSDFERAEFRNETNVENKRTLHGNFTIAR